MMSLRRPVFKASFVLAAVLVVNGCGSSVLPVGEAAELASTLFYEPRAGFGDRASQWRIESQELVAECMLAEGFTFTPSADTGFESFDEKDRLGDRAWAQEYGYGIGSSYENVVNSQLLDPNLATTSALSELERIEYMIALVGAGRAGGARELPPLDEQGCTGWAAKEMGGVAWLNQLEQTAAEWAEAEGTVLARAESQRAIDGWSRCMSDAGYALAQPDDAAAAATNELFAFIEPLVESMTQDPNVAELVLRSGKGIAGHPDFDRSQLDGLVASEIAMALIDLDCANEHLAPVLDELLGQARTAFVEENVDAVRSALKGPDRQR